MFPIARIVPFVIAGLLLSLFARGAAEFDSGSLKAEEKASPPSVEFHFRLTEPEFVEAVEANVASQAVPVQFTPFSREEHNSTAILFLIDNSDPKRAKTVEASKALVLRLLETVDAHCQFAVYSFAANLEPIAEFGTAKDEVRAKLKPLRAIGLATELYRDSIEAIKVLEGVQARRKALILFSDGRAEDTSFNLDQTVAEARKGGVAIFGVGYAESPQLTIYLQSLRRLAAETGGQFAEAEIGSRKEPAAFSHDFFNSLTSGGTAVANLAEVHSGNAVEFSVHTKESRILKHVYPLVSLHLEPPPPPPSPPASTPAPAPVVEATPAPKGIPAAETPSPATPSPEHNAADAVSNHSADASGIPLKGSPKVPTRPWPLILAGSAATLLAGLFSIIFVMRQPSRRTPFPQSGKTADGRVYARLQMLDAEGTEHLIRTTAFRLGRGRDNDLVLHNDSISRHHAEIHHPREGGFVITDLGAGNGIIVNGRKVEKAALQNEDLIELGEVRIRFLIA